MTYASLDEFRSHLGIADVGAADVLAQRLAAAHAAVDRYCGRSFDLATASARVFSADHGGAVRPHDIATAAGVIVETDDNDDGTYGTTWDAADYLLAPANGLGPNGAPAPYTLVLATRTRWFPTCTRRPAVRITAAWGWPAVPEDVKLATLLVATSLFRRTDSRNGFLVLADGGALRLSRDEVAAVTGGLLDAYRRMDAVAGIA